MAERRKSTQDVNRIIDIMHICFGIIIVIMAVVAFINPDRYMIFFPVIFFLAAVLNMVNGIQRFKESGHDKKKKSMGVLIVLLGVILIMISIVSGISIWG